MFLYLLSMIGMFLGIVLIIVSLAAGLYYLAELIEEYTIFTKKCLLYASVGVGLSHILLVFLDGFPILHSLFSIFTLGWYSLMLKEFPVIEVFSPIFIGSCILVIANHFLWFFWFTHHAYTLAEIGSFFGILVWAVPFTYFISLSANEYTLPAFDLDSAHRRRDDHLPGSDLGGKKGGGNLIKSFVNSITSGFDKSSFKSI